MQTQRVDLEFRSVKENGRRSIATAPVQASLAIDVRLLTASAIWRADRSRLRDGGRSLRRQFA